MITLFLDTASGPAGIAVTRNGETLVESTLNMPGKRQNSLLLPELQRILTEAELAPADIDLMACTIGPGAFTGLRTSIATVQGLALAHGKPCVGISTLAMLAMNVPYTDVQICPMLDARKNEVYTGVYKVDTAPHAIIADAACSPAALLQKLNTPTLFLGDGSRRYQDLIVATLGKNALFAPQSFHIPRPAYGAMLAEQFFKNGVSLLPEQLLPTYLRLSEAELSRRQKYPHA